MKNINQLFTLNSSIQPLLTNIYNFKRFKGNYVLISCIEKRDKHGDSYWVLELSDISATIKVYCFNLNVNFKQLNPNAIIHVEATLKEKHGQHYVRGAFIQPVSKTSQLSHISVNLLPHGYCAKPNLLIRFKHLVDQIQSSSLKQFLAQVLIDDLVSYRYLQCPASLRHHHNFAGGLLEHSIEVAEYLLCENTFNKKEYDIAIVAALLHDIGKTKTITTNGTRTAIGMMVDHDELTLEICGFALAQLDKREPHTAMLLRHVWTCASPNARYGYQAITPIATALQAADKKSASNVNTININTKIA